MTEHCGHRIRSSFYQPIVSVTLSDLSSGMLRDARRAMGRKDSRFSFEAFDCAEIPHARIDSFDLVIADHVLFYCEDIPAVCREIHRVLVPGGKFVCSTYGSRHMQEVSQLVQDFDESDRPVCRQTL